MRWRRCVCVLTVMVLFVPVQGGTVAPIQKDDPELADVVRGSVRKLIKMQDGGQWKYIWQGSGAAYPHSVASTAIVAQSLLLAAPDDPAAQAAVQRALTFLLKALEDKQMRPIAMKPLKAPNAGALGLDRIWAHAFSLELFCQVRARKIAPDDQKKAIDARIPLLIEAIATQELPEGGWGYLITKSGNAPPFVTALVTQALLLASSQGEKVPDEIFTRSRKNLEKARQAYGAFNYDGEPSKDKLFDSIQNSAGRSTLCETTLVLLGGGSVDAVRVALANFHKHWGKLERRRQEPGTHGPAYAIAPYYFYFAHRYATQAIHMLPEEERARARQQVQALILRARDNDGTWNDWYFPTAAPYGTAMVVMALLGDKTPIPSKLVTAGEKEEAAVKALRKLGVDIIRDTAGKSVTGVRLVSERGGGSHVKKDVLWPLLQDLPALQSIDLSKCISDEDLDKLKAVKHLRELVLSNCRLSDAGLKSLQDLTELRKLQLQGTSVTGTGLKDLQALKNLQALDLSRTEVADAGLKDLPLLKSLQSLNLSRTDVTDAGLKDLETLQELQSLGLSTTSVTNASLKNLQTLKNLQSLDLGKTAVSDAGLKDLLSFKNLQSLDLSNTKVTDTGLKDLRSLTNLQSLNLSNTRVTDTGINDLQPLKLLRSLDLSSTRVTNAGLKDLQPFQQLQSLGLNGNMYLSDAGLKGLQGLMELRSLSIRFTEVTDAGLKDLEPLKNLQSLDLRFTQATDAGVAELKKALPNITVNIR